MPVHHVRLTRNNRNNVTLGLVSVNSCARACSRADVHAHLQECVRMWWRAYVNVRMVSTQELAIKKDNQDLLGRRDV